MSPGRPPAEPRAAARPPARIAYCDGARLRRALLAAADRVSAERSDLDRINVFPVADGDTGTNLALTLRSVADAVRPLQGASLHDVAQTAARAGVLAARGNSGMLVSQFLLGFASHLGRRARAGAAEVADAAVAGARSLGEALETPREGTILTVAREAARSGRDRARKREDLYDWLCEVRETARRSLARTRDMLPALREAGVVDAGARGFVEMLEGVVHLVDRGGEESAGDGGGEIAAGPVPVDGSGEPGEGRYCTQLAFEGGDLPSSEAIRGLVHGLGTSLIVIRAGDLARVHIHADEPAAVERALDGLGPPVSRRVEDTQAAPDGRAVRTGRVVTDSSADLPPAWVREKGVEVVPLRVIVGDRDFRDGVDLDAEEVLRLLTDPDSPHPTTSQPPAADFARAYRHVLEGGAERFLGVFLSSAVSGTFEAARKGAREVGPERGRLVDSRSGSLGLGLLVIRAVELLEEGASTEEVAAELERVRDRSNLVFAVARIDWLLRSGRLGRGQAWLARLMGIVPVLELDGEGNVVPRARVRGQEAAREEIFRAVDEGLAGARRYRIGVVHAGVPDLAASVEEEVRRRWDPLETYCRPITAVLAAHAGPGAWGIAYQVEDQL
ncbi:MAG TPA: DegV family protein [Gemmatimonadota bacterium]|nr:DegV family protein [Gemmatimonadota bacterium]